MKPITGVTFILKRQTGDILMQLRDGNARDYPHTWCFPGGARESDEDFIHTLLREVKEEYSLDLKESDCKFLIDFDEGNQINKVYICEVPSNQTPIMKEGAAMKWMTLDEIEKLKLGFNQDRLLPSLKMVTSKRLQ